MGSNVKLLACSVALMVVYVTVIDLHLQNKQLREELRAVVADEITPHHEIITPETQREFIDKLDKDRMELLKKYTGGEYV